MSTSAWINRLDVRPRARHPLIMWIPKHQDWFFGVMLMDERWSDEDGEIYEKNEVSHWFYVERPE